MTDDRGTLRSIAWRELCPWLLLFRTFWLGLSVPLLLLATVGVIVQPAGWWVAGVFISDETWTDRDGFRYEHERLTAWPGEPDRVQLPAGDDVLQPALGHSSLRMLVTPMQGDFAGIFDRISFPFVRMFEHDLTLGMFAYYVFGGLWTLALWTLIGGAITRVAVVWLGLEERQSIRSALGYVGRRYGYYFAAPLYPLLGIALLAIPIAILGLLMWVADFGVIIAGLFWIFALLAALGMTFLSIGLLFGWPLMFPAISAENGDAFEALSRSFGYTFQRPFHYAFYILVSALFAALCWLFVSFFADTVVNLAEWGGSWGAGHERMVRIDAASVVTDEQNERLIQLERGYSWSLRTGAGIIRFWEHLVYCVAWGFAYSLFFCLSSAIYLLLRQVDDETEIDEIYLDDDDERYTLPEVKRDDAGVPVMTLPPPKTPSQPPENPTDLPLADEE
jgi:hypothetical protein